jgi:hypothetical protein
MLVVLTNAVKVESVPLNFNFILPPMGGFLRNSRVTHIVIRTYDRQVGKLPSIGYNGQPLRDPFRLVRPPIPVLIDLTVLFPREPHRDGRYHPHGLQMHKVVEGRLSCWGICEQGDWWGLVTYEIVYGAKRKAVTHWVPAWILRRRKG